MNEKEKAELGANSVRHFVNQFGQPDEYVTILLEVLMEELNNVSPIHLLSESEQEGDQIIDNDSIGETSERSDLLIEQFESTENLGNQDIKTD